MSTMQYVRYPATGGGVGAMTIGGSVTGGTSGSVLFVGTGPVLAQDNANFNYNSTTHDLSITGALSASNLSGTNTGDVTLTAVGSSPSANGASLSGQVLTLQPADATHPGLLTSGSQTIGGAKTFSSTIAASNFSGSSSGTNTGDVTIGTANGLSLVGQALSLGLSSTSTTGALSSTDWNTFNTAATNAANKALSNLASVAINTALLPNSTNSINFGASGLTWANGYFAGILRAATIIMNNGAQDLVRIDSDPVTIPSAILVPAIYNPNGPSGLAGSRDFGVFTQSGNSGNPTGSIHIESGNNTNGAGITGDVILRVGTTAGTRGKITLQDGSEGTAGYVWTSTDTTGKGQWAAASGGSSITSLTGDVTATGPGAAASTIASNVVTNAKLAQMSTLTIKGNNTGGTANASDLTVAQVNAILPVFTSVLNGLVPASGGGTTNFLRADGTWAVAGTGTVTSVALADSTGLFNITGSPVTGSGTLTLASLQSQAQHSFFAGPSGASGAPTFRAIVASDVPTLNQNTTGTALNITASSNSTLTTLSALSLPGSQVTGNISGNSANVTGVVAIANGGTGSATQNFVDLSTNQTIAGAKQFSSALTLTQVSTPSTPSSGLDKLYVKSDGNLYLIGSDGVERIVGPGMSGTNWQSNLTFVPGAGFGTTSGPEYFYRRVGDSMQVRGSFVCGTVSGSPIAIDLPGGFSLDTAKIATAGTQPLGHWYALSNGGQQSLESSNRGGPMFVDASTSTTTIYGSPTSASSQFEKLGVSSAVPSNNSFGFEFTVPITGWTVNNGNITNSEVWVTDSDVGAPAYGTTNTAVRRFLTTTKNIGTDITYVDDASLGGSFTVNTGGVYCITYVDTFASPDYFGIVVNGTQGSTNIDALTVPTEAVSISTTNSSNFGSTTVTLNLSASDVIWAQINTSIGINPSAGLRKYCSFRVVKIA